MWLPAGLHVLDLKADGYIDYHIDNHDVSGRLETHTLTLQHFGGVLAGLSLLSPSIMTLRRDHEELELFLEPRTLYIQR